MKLFILAGVAALAVGASAGVWNELGDATELLPGQMTVGSGSLDQIFGAIVGNDADLYCIHIDQGPVLWSATTTNALTSAQDTQLFLFDANGNPIAMNDDNPAGATFTSRLTPGHVLYASLAPGDYLLAISEYDKDPLNGAGAQMFPDTPFNAVNGPSAGGPLAGWDANGSSGSAFQYQIDLTGTSYCAVPEPATFLALGAGLALLASRRRRK